MFTVSDQSSCGGVMKWVYASLHTEVCRPEVTLCGGWDVKSQELTTEVQSRLYQDFPLLCHPLSIPISHKSKDKYALALSDVLALSYEHEWTPRHGFSSFQTHLPLMEHLWRMSRAISTPTPPNHFQRLPLWLSTGKIELITMFYSCDVKYLQHYV